MNPQLARVPAQRIPGQNWERSHSIAPIPAGPLLDDSTTPGHDHHRGGARTLAYAESADALTDPAAQILGFLNRARGSLPLN
jgi:hypothetical protein